MEDNQQEMPTREIGVEQSHSSELSCPESLGVGKNEAKSVNSPQVDKTPQSQTPEEDLCVICFSNPQNSVNMPCGHGTLCIQCSLDVMKKSDDCCICRELVEQVLELDVDGSRKRNDCWRVKKCYVFFEEGSSYSEDESILDSSELSNQQSPNPLVETVIQTAAHQDRPVRDEEVPQV